MALVFLASLSGKASDTVAVLIPVSPWESAPATGWRDKLMALMGPSSPFVSSHCAPNNVLLSFILLLPLVTTG